MNRRKSVNVLRSEPPNDQEVIQERLASSLVINLPCSSSKTNVVNLMRSRAVACLVVLLQAAILATGQQSNCDFAQLKNQEKDVATIQRLEMAWNEAYIHGDTNLMRCLLASDFTEIMRSGEVKSLPDELSMAEKNRGKELKVPESPRVNVLLYENAAVAYGKSFSTSKDGKAQIRWYSDSYLWKDGQWHAFFAQQTAADEPRSSP